MKNYIISILFVIGMSCIVYLVCTNEIVLWCLAITLSVLGLYGLIVICKVALDDIDSQIRELRKS